MNSLIKIKNRRSTLGRKKIENNYDIVRIVKEYEKLYKDLSK